MDVIFRIAALRYNDNMKSYKSKDHVALCIFLIPAILIACLDVRFCYHMYELGLEKIIAELSTAILALSLLFSFTGLIIFWLLNICPIRINVYSDSFEFVYVCRNKIKVKAENIKVLTKENDANGWYVILYMRKRFTRVSSDEFPKLKNLLGW